MTDMETKDKRPPLKVGERVRLASGGPEMTVIAQEPGKVEIVRVAWWVETTKEIKDRLLPAAALERTVDVMKQVEAALARGALMSDCYGLLASVSAAISGRPLPALQAAELAERVESIRERLGAAVDEDA